MRGLMLILSLSMLVGCYSPRKARTQFAKATVAYPEIAAEYCSKTYPVKDSFIRGVDSIRVDTLWGSEAVTVYDTIFSRDTVFIRITKQLPGITIREIYNRTDTINKENTAKSDALLIALKNAANNEALVIIDRDKWRKIARKRFWIIAGMGAVMVLGVVAAVRKRLTKSIV